MFLQKTKTQGTVFLLTTLVISFLAFPTLAKAEDDSELAKKSQNPVADLISVPFQNNMNFGLEPNHRTQNVLNIQPVIPFELTDDWNLITRTIMPVIKQPDLRTTSDDTWGIGGYQYDPVLRTREKHWIDLKSGADSAIPHGHG